MQAETAALRSDDWRPHYNTADYEGDWDIAPMRAVGGDPDVLFDELQPGGKVLAGAAADIYVEDSPDAPMDAQAVTGVGGGASHENVMPFQAINYIVALTGIFPSRN